MISQGVVPGIPGATFRRVDRLEAHLPDSVAVGPYMQARPQQVLFAMPGAGLFLARDGTTIELAPAANADAGAVKLFLYGIVRTALIHQRGELPLHSAALLPPGGSAAVAICGPSGAGKSTLAAELSRRGWLLLAENATRVTWDGSGAMAWPSGDSIKLWRDACDVVKADPAKLERVVMDVEKYYLPVPMRHEPIRLGAVVGLERGGEATAMSAGEKLSLIMRNTVKRELVEPLGRRPEHVRIAAHVASSTDVRVLCGARGVPVQELADRIERLAERDLAA